MSKKMNRRAFIGTALTFGALAAAAPGEAFGVTAAQKRQEVQAVAAQLSALESEMDAVVDQYNQCQDQYNAATQACNEAQAQIDEAQAKIDTLQDHLASRATSMYRNGSMSYLDVLLGVGSFADFATVWDTLNTLNSEDADLVVETQVAKSELETAKAELDNQQAAAQAALDAAAAYRDQIQAKEAEYEAMYNSLSSEYQTLVAQEQAAAAAAAAQQQQASRPSSSAPSSTPAPAPSIPSHGSVADYAASRIGCPYVWGAAGPDKFDCSGLTMWCYAQAGVASLPHYTESQKACARARFSPSEAASGDVLYRSGHVAVSTGGLSYIHAPGRGKYVCAASGGNWTYALRF